MASSGDWPEKFESNVYIQSVVHCLSYLKLSTLCRNIVAWEKTTAPLPNISEIENDFENYRKPILSLVSPRASSSLSFAISFLST